MSGERFNYVVAHLDMTFDFHSKKLTLTKGKRMEFTDVIY